MLFEQVVGPWANYRLAHQNRKFVHVVGPWANLINWLAAVQGGGMYLRSCGRARLLYINE